MIPAMESVGFVFSARNETANITTHAMSSQRNIRPWKPKGISGLKRTAIERKQIPQKYFSARKA